MPHSLLCFPERRASYPANRVRVTIDGSDSTAVRGEAMQKGRFQMALASLLGGIRTNGRPTDGGAPTQQDGAGADAMTAAYRAFRRQRPTFDSTALLDDLRLWEYGRLDDGGHIYLDYTGGGLYAESQLRAHMGLLR